MTIPLPLEVGGVVGMVVMTVVAAVAAAIVWLIGLANWQEARSIPTTHHPARYFHLRQQAWDETPTDLGTWLTHGTVDGSPDRDRTLVAAVGEVVSVAGGLSSDDEGTPAAGTVTLRGADGTTVAIEADLRRIDNVRPGTFLPHHPARSDGDDEDPGPRLAWDLTAAEVRDLLLVHRLQRGLLTVAEADLVLSAAVAGERPRSARVHGIRPTGRIRQGHVEVDLVIGTRDGWHTTRTFLRPEEIATVRHNGRVLVVRSVDNGADDPVWVVWPTWF